MTGQKTFGKESSGMNTGSPEKIFLKKYFPK